MVESILSTQVLLTAFVWTRNILRDCYGINWLNLTKLFCVMTRHKSCE